MNHEVVVLASCVPGESVLDALRREGIAPPAPCGGSGTCGKCRVGLRRAGTEAFEEVLACQVTAESGMEVALAGAGTDSAMDVSLEGACGSARFLPDGQDEGWGVAFDVGTTTLVCKLIDLASGKVLARAGAPNPQGTFGADVISRITAVGEGHLDELAGLVNGELAHLIERVIAEAREGETTVECRRGHANGAAGIRRAVLCGNTVMEHLACGMDPSPIGRMPFTPPSHFGDMRALPALAEAGCATREALFVSCIAGYVGGDITADLLASDLSARGVPVLMLDLGTNGEMALGSSQGIVSCATAAGPVFEGANIQFGMPAYPGAVSRVRFAAGALSVETIGGAPPAGICGTGLIDTLALLLDWGIVDESGFMVDAEELDGSVPEALLSRLGEYDDMAAFWVTPDIAVTQRDVRNIQLAKAAIFAGIQTLLGSCGLDASGVGGLIVAGGFGQYLDLAHAARIGLFPQELVAVADSVGNIAIEGASMVLVSAAARREMQRIAQESRYIELSGSSEFNAAYMEAMEFPS